MKTKLNLPFLSALSFCFLMLSSVYAADYTISVATTWPDQTDVPSDIGSLTVAQGVTLTIGDTNSTYEANGITVSVANDLIVNGTIACVGEYTDDTNGVGIIFVVGNDCAVSGAGKIDANDKGYPYGHGPGANTNYTDHHGPGGSHGGQGGKGGKPCYGSITNPVALGSSGNNYSGSGGGGGAIKLDVGNTLIVNGIICANGGQNSLSYGSGGAGGSIWIIAKNIAGTNSITANGGAGDSYASGGGGGGRIAILGYTNYTFSGALSVADGRGANYPSLMACPGTIYLDNWADLPSTINTGVVVGLPGWGQLATNYNVGHDITVTNGGKLYMRGNTSLTLNNLVLGGFNSKLWLEGETNANLPFGAGVTINAQNIEIGPGSSIDANYFGFPQGHGPGASTYTGEPGPGGSHGGKGGRGRSSTDVRPCYGSVSNPVALGSGGNSNANHRGSVGGGAIKLDVADTLTVNGIICANGENAPTTYASAGSGGSIWIVAKNIAGASTNASITANGGAAGYSDGGGDGGGGRIAILGYTNYTFSGALSVANGSVGYANYPSLMARPGTIYLDNWADLPSIINTGIVVGLPGPEFATNYNAAGHDITVTNGGKLYMRGNTSLTLDNLVLGGNGSKLWLDGETNANLPFGAGVTINAQNIEIGQGSSIDANYFGFPYGHGPGASTNLGGDGPGGSHGGQGGRGAGSSDVQPCYGSVSNPVALGSGGNNREGSGGGGGAIKLDVADTLTVNGIICANGENSGRSYRPGGSGGSIWIIAKNIAGTSTNASITANGGAGSPLSGSGGWGGGGGGGRIAIMARKDNFTEEIPGTYTNYPGSTNGLITVKGGAGKTDGIGTNGTFHLEILRNVRTVFIMH